MIFNILNDRPKLYLWAIILILSGLTYFQIPVIKELGDLLWAEDANVFINDVYSQGLSSIIKPYAGYLHLYPRFWSMLLPYIGIHNAPIWLFAGWFAAVIVMGFLLVKALNSVGIKSNEALLLLALIYLQPSNGEIYFTITNAQWFLGFALGAWYLIKLNVGNTVADLVILSILILTGPFGVLLLPVLSIKYFVFKNSKPDKIVIFLYMLCVGVQILSMLTSVRVSSPVDLNLTHWLKAAGVFITMGLPGLFKLLALGLWLFVANGIFQVFRDKNCTPRQQGAVLIIIYGLVIYAASLYASRNAPHILSPFGGGSRYFWIPYASLFAAAILFASKQWTKYGIYALIFVICCVGLSEPKIQRNPTDFRARLKFSEIEKRNIKINPFWEVWPDVWRINYAQPKLISTPHVFHELTIDDVLGVRGDINKKSEILSIQNQDSDPYLIFKIPAECEKYKYIALIADTARESPSYAQFFWGNSQNHKFLEKYSRSSFVGKGRNELVYAIEKNFNVDMIRFDPSGDKELQNIYKLKMYCY